MKIGNTNVDRFFEEYERRISDEDTRHTPQAKEAMRKVLPAMKLLARSNPEEFEQRMIRAFASITSP